MTDSTKIALSITLLICGIVAIPTFFVGSHCHREKRLEEAQLACISDFVTAWAGERFEDAWLLTLPIYRQKVSRERFVAEMREHPFLPTVTGGSFEHDWAGRYEGLLQTDAGPVAAGIFFGPHEKVGLWEIEVDDWPVLPPSDLSLVTAHAFARALVARAWRDAYQQTHPTYRAGVDAEQFAEAFAKNVWLLEATGFRAKKGDATDDAVRATGALLSAKGSVEMTLHLGQYENQWWITEAFLGGTPTLPEPTSVEVRYEADE